MKQFIQCYGSDDSMCVMLRTSKVKSFSIKEINPTCFWVVIEINDEDEWEDNEFYRVSGNHESLNEAIEDMVEIEKYYFESHPRIQ